MRSKCPSRLRLARIEAGLIQIELCRKASLSPSRLSLLENRHVEPSVDEKRRLARALRRSVEELFPQLSRGSTPTV